MSPTQKMALLSIGTSCATLALKFWAYFLTNSVSLYSDALESLVNLAAATIALIVLTIAERPADATHPWGHEKAEYFSSGIEGALIFVAAFSIGWTAILRLAHPTPPDQLSLGLLVSVTASALNGATALVLLRQAKKHDSIVLEADARHLLTDVWTSVGVVGALAVLLIMPTWWLLDPIIALVVACNILYTGFDLMRRSANDLMDAALPAEDIGKIHRAIQDALPAEARYDALRTRKAGARRLIEFKLYLPPQTALADSHALCDKLEVVVAQAVGRSETVVHTEPIQAP